jgi:hypothetical protein
MVKGQAFGEQCLLVVMSDDMNDTLKKKHSCSGTEPDHNPKAGFA